MKDMKRLINISAGDQSEAWIGLYDQTHGNRTWRWSLPEVEFNESETNWNDGEPNDARSQVIYENCVIVNTNLKWIDVQCQSSRRFLCYNETNTTHKYHLIKEEKSWQEAQSYCREKHTDLISGMKQLQDEEVKKLLNSNYQPYIGLFRDTWRWSDGSSFSFRHWNPIFNNHNPNSGQCAMTKFDGEGRWTNVNCDDKKPFICYDDKLILIKEAMNWEDALTYCRGHHYNLVTITNVDDQKQIQEKVKEASTDYVWMGLRYACTLDLWFWVSDEMVSDENWAKGEPMDDCDMSGAMETGGEHQWKKKNDTEKFNFICSKN
ncbi:C-type mannose receptor 2-like isoform X2 [Poecilia latipinna]|uniref:C-type mannose receptor 2-like isoform X2 n=1 Tax=Poecilia latipinna TaxID=48699 RepID=UPI00072EE739|nr:PREDICTED: C-type mannose receptor 2-like isoform X2 [Poecilia latipinna]